MTQMTTSSKCKDVCTTRNVILLICSVLCVYQLIGLLYSFFIGDKWGTTSILNEKMSIRFPNVTLCSFNRINKSKANEIGLTKEYLQPFLDKSGLLQNWTSFDKYKDAVSIEEYMYLMVFYAGTGELPLVSLSHASMKGDSSLKHARKFYNYMKTQRPEWNITTLAHQLAHTCHKSVFHCKFQETYRSDCCRVHKQVFMDYGVCTEHQPQTESGTPYQSKLGIRGGYTMIYNQHVDEFVEVTVDNFLEQGLVMYLGYDGLAGSPIAMHSGMHMYVELMSMSEEISTTGVSLYPTPCTTQQKTTNLKLRYTYESCKEDCWFSAILNQCGCIPQAVPRDRQNGHSYCEPDDYEECIFHRISSDLKNITYVKPYIISLHQCAQSCKSECTKEYVKHSVTYAKFPSVAVEQSFVNYMYAENGIVMPKEHLSKDLIVIDIYFKTLAETVIQRYPKATIEQLVSNIGGLSGLWLGASILTIYEVINSIYEACLKKLNPKSKSEVAAEDTFTVTSRGLLILIGMIV